MDWFKIGKRVHQSSILSPWLFSLDSEYIMQNAGLDESQAEIKIAGKNNNLRCRWYHSNGRKWRELRSLLMWVKSWLKIHHSKNEGHGIQSHHFMANRWGEKWKQWQILFSWAPKLLQMLTAASKRHLLLGRKATTNLDRVLNSTAIILLTKMCSQSCGFSSSHVWMWEVDHKEG